jgi:PTS system fructose-specific IIA component
MDNFITEDQVFVGQDADSRLTVLRNISDKAQALGITDDADTVYDAFIWRENQCETGMEDGFAIPHAKSDAIKRAAVIVYKTKDKLEWPSFDKQPVDISIALLVPAVEAGTTHLKLLSKTATLLLDEDFRAAVRNSNDAAELARLINDGVAASDDDDDEDEDDE